MSTKGAFGLGFALSVAVFICLCVIVPTSNSFIDFAAGLGFSIDQRGAGAMGLIFGFVFPALAFFGVPAVNAKCIDVGERRRAEAEESRKRKYQDNPLAGELAEKVYQSMVYGIEGANRGKRVQIISVSRTVSFDGCCNRIVLVGPYYHCDHEGILYSGQSENVVFSEPDAFVYSICAIVLDRLREKYHVDPSGGKIVTLRVKPDKSISSKCRIEYEAWNPNYEKPKVI